MTRTLLAFSIALGVSSVAAAGDWPQILGPNRNGLAVEEKLADNWPKDGPPTVWKRSVGHGLAGVAVADGVAVLFHRLGNQDLVEAMDARTGQVRWTQSFPTSFEPQIIDDDGPRCVPLIDHGRVYVFGAQGDLRCLNLKDGTPIWKRATHKDFQALSGYFGAGGSPILEGDKLLLNVGGDRVGAGIVAFDLDTGKTLWKATNQQASYSSPIAATIDGARHVIFVTRLSVVSIDPENGKLRFEFPFGQRGPTVNGANPVLLGDHLFVTASYGIGAVWAKLRKNKADVEWTSDNLLSSQYTTPIAADGLLYGIHGRQDGPPAALRCVDPTTKKYRWTEDAFGYATLIAADGKLLIQKTDGELILAALNPDRFQRLASVRLFGSETRPLPALANGLYYVRDTSTLKCVDLRASVGK